jgi:hypothetical protein
VPQETEPSTTAAALTIADEITGDNSGAGPVIDLSVYQCHIDRNGGVS